MRNTSILKGVIKSLLLVSVVFALFCCSTIPPEKGGGNGEEGEEFEDFEDRPGFEIEKRNGKVVINITYGKGEAKITDMFLNGASQFWFEGWYQFEGSSLTEQNLLKIKEYIDKIISNPYLFNRISWKYEDLVTIHGPEGAVLVFGILLSLETLNQQKDNYSDRQITLIRNNILEPLPEKLTKINKVSVMMIRNSEEGGKGTVRYIIENSGQIVEQFIKTYQRD